METLAGRLGHISETVPLLRFMMLLVYTNVAHILSISKAHLINTRKDFRDMKKLLKKKSVIPSQTQEDVSNTDGITESPTGSDTQEVRARE